MTKSQLIDNVAAENGLTKVDAKKAVESVLNNIQRGLKNDGKTSLQGFGNFSTAERKARVGRNPQTGQPVEIAAKTVVKFKAQF
jgi:DNA-binding protein HU-beta